MDRSSDRRPDVLAAQNAVSSMGRTRQLSGYWTLAFTPQPFRVPTSRKARYFFARFGSSGIGMPKASLINRWNVSLG